MNPDFADVTGFHCVCGETNLIFSDATITKNKICYLFYCPKCTESTLVLEEILNDEPLQINYLVMDKSTKTCKHCKLFLFEQRTKPRRRICFSCGYDNLHPNIKPESEKKTSPVKTTNYSYTPKPVYTPDPLFMETILLNKPAEAINV